ncbi:MAG: carboxypeptidase-like regulatory domain-containing protein [Mangrovibacterium sp.]
MKKIASNKISVVILNLFLVLSSCSDDFTLTTGDITGVASPEGIKVTFDRGDKKFTAVTAGGGFSIENLEAGIYDITYEKDGYFTYKKFGFQFLGGPSELVIPGSVYLYKKPIATVTIDSVTKDGNYWLSISGTYKSNQDIEDPNYLDQLSILWLVNDQKNVSLTNYKVKEWSTSYKVRDGQYSAVISFQKKDYGNFQTIYLLAYPKSPSDTYYDWEKNEEIISVGGNPSSVFEYKIPSDFFNQ